VVAEGSPINVKRNSPSVYAALKNTANGYAASSITAVTALSSSFNRLRASRRKYVRATKNETSEMQTPVQSGWRPRTTERYRIDIGNAGKNAMFCW
jgi:hypothetical protein